MHWVTRFKTYPLNSLKLMPITLLLLVSACAQTAESDNDNLGRYLFDVYEENHAWAYTLRGFYIDREGQVRTYDRGDDKWVPTASDRAGRLSEADLADKFDGARKVVMLDPGTVREKAGMVHAASRGAMSRFSQSRDRGRYAYVAYLYDPDRGNYRSITLGAEGDWTETNASPAARKLIDWLNEVKEKIAETQR